MSPQRAREHYDEEITLAVLREHDRMLFGNGQPGIISELRGKIDRLTIGYYLALGAILVMQFLSSSGVVSLKGIIGK